VPLGFLQRTKMYQVSYNGLHIENPWDANPPGLVNPLWLSLPSRTSRLPRRVTRARAWLACRARGFESSWQPGPPGPEVPKKSGNATETHW
jgi:hypothetical protein